MARGEHVFRDAANHVPHAAVPPYADHAYCDGNAGFKAADTALYPDQLIPSERARYRVEVSPGKFIDLCPNHYRRHETVFAAAGYRTLAADSN